MRRKSIEAAAFRTHCSKILNEVVESRKAVTIMRDGQPMAVLHPVRRRTKSIIGAMAGSVLYEGDMISPLDVEWDALEGKPLEPPVD